MQIDRSIDRTNERVTKKTERIFKQKLQKYFFGSFNSSSFTPNSFVSTFYFRLLSRQLQACRHHRRRRHRPRSDQWQSPKIPETWKNIPLRSSIPSLASWGLRERPVDDVKRSIRPNRRNRIPNRNWRFRRPSRTSRQRRVVPELTRRQFDRLPTFRHFSLSRVPQLFSARSLKWKFRYFNTYANYSVTISLHYFFNFWRFTAMNICQIA